jgi:hypothetical protein
MSVFWFVLTTRKANSVMWQHDGKLGIGKTWLSKLLRPNLILEQCSITLF